MIHGMYPHRIRLRGPWEAAGRTVKLPGPVPGFTGRVALSRRFGYPGTIDAQERVWLVVEGLRRPARLSLNGEALGELSTSGEFDVTSRLLERNGLVIETETDGESPWAEVALEVRATAWLRRLALRREGDGLVATGEAIGAAPGPLDLYLVAGRRTAAYLSIIPTPEGTPFRLAGTPEPGEDGPAKVELAWGGVLWHSATLAEERDGDPDAEAAPRGP